MATITRPVLRYYGGKFRMAPRLVFDFIQHDALELNMDWVREFDFIWASPICKGDSCIRFFGHNRHRTWEQQIPRTRLILNGSGKPYVIENVPRAPLETDHLLCGRMFGLPLIRHRLFETNFTWLRPPHVCARRGSVNRGETIVVAGHAGGKSRSNCRMPYWSKEEGIRALGIDWMTRAEMAEAIPPAYSEFIARQFRRPQ